MILKREKSIIKVNTIILLKAKRAYPNIEREKSIIEINIIILLKACIIHIICLIENINIYIVDL
jgi:hypothetical protein